MNRANKSRYYETSIKSQNKRKEKIREERKPPESDGRQNLKEAERTSQKLAEEKRDDEGI